MAYEPEEMELLGQREVLIEWENSINEEGLDDPANLCQQCMAQPLKALGYTCQQEFEIHIARNQRFPVTTLAHELIHLYNRMVGPDNIAKVDEYVRGYETMLNDMVANHWEFLQALRKEVLK